MKIRKFDRDFLNAYLRIEQVSADRRGASRPLLSVRCVLVTYANDPNKGTVPERLLPDRAFLLKGVPVATDSDEGVIERDPIDSTGNLFEQAYNELKAMDEFITAEDV